MFRPQSKVVSPSLQGFIVAILSVGCFVGALFAGSKLVLSWEVIYIWCMIYTFTISLAFSDFAGRKITIIVGGLLYGVGGILQSGAFFLWLVHAVHTLYSGKHFANWWKIQFSQRKLSQIACFCHSKFCKENFCKQPQNCKICKSFLPQKFQYSMMQSCKHVTLLPFFISIYRMMFVGRFIGGLGVG